MSLRMVMSLTPSLAYEHAEDDGQLTLDLPADFRLQTPELRFPQRRADSTSTGRQPDRIDAALEEMRDFLSEMHLASDAEALQSLRLAFPTVPLTDRIAAIKTRFFA